MASSGLVTQPSSVNAFVAVFSGATHGVERESEGSFVYRIAPVRQMYTKLYHQRDGLYVLGRQSSPEREWPFFYFPSFLAIEQTFDIKIYSVYISGSKSMYLFDLSLRWT